MKKVTVVLMSILLIIALAACGSETKTKTASTGGGGGEDVIKIGGIFAASGGAAPLGKGEMDTAKMLAEQINEAGGINGKKVELIAYDSKSDQNEAVLSMKKLIEQDKVLAIVGGTTSGNTLAMLPQAMKAKVPFVSLAASKQINNPSDGSSREWVFKTAQGDDVVIPKVLEYLKSENLTKVAWLNVANSFGTSGHEEFMQLSPDYGVEAVIEEEFEATVNDAKAMLTRVKKANPDAVIVWGTAQESAVVTKNIHELNMDIPVVESHGIASSKFLELAGDAAEGVVFPAGRILVADQLADSDKQKETITTFKDDFEEKFGYPASAFAGHAWDGIQVLKQAIEEGGEDREAIKKALENTTDFVGISGVFNMSADDHNGLGSDSLIMIEVKDGNWTIKE
ncbi:ABC transporter substrate-binding protein [Bacillus marinisedimentorum]|uniref:ABC transporter substrate-binding protein n=1 Tax=Bacillus marinisedimentorum TaxID=1821260 RepID=UPI000872457E|nr:ABC transporter substrate-binding protein [Bacillus marinisedimentorum]